MPAVIVAQNLSMGETIIFFSMERFCKQAYGCSGETLYVFSRLDILKNERLKRLVSNVVKTTLVDDKLWPRQGDLFVFSPPLTQISKVKNLGPLHTVPRYTIDTSTSTQSESHSVCRQK